MKTPKFNLNILLLTSLFLLASLPNTSDAGWLGGRGSVAGITSAGGKVTQIVLADNAQVLLDETGEGLSVAGGPLGNLGRFNGINGGVEDTNYWLQPQNFAVKSAAVRTSDIVAEDGTSAVSASGGLTVSASKDLTLGDNARLLFGTADEYGFQVDDTGNAINLVFAGAENTGHKWVLGSNTLYGAGLYFDTIANRGGGGPVTLAQGATVSIGKSLAVETITPLSGGNITIEEHADDGGSDFFSGQVNSQTIISSPALWVKLNPSGVNELTVSASSTQIENYFVMREVGMPGCASATYAYLWADSTSSDVEGCTANTQTTLVDEP